MKLSKSQFEENQKNGNLKLCFIGMSNIGKTLWSRKLSHTNFTHICCDDLIEYEIGHELQALGYKGIEEVAKWLGQPYEERFKANQSTYVEEEVKVMKEVLVKINAANGNIALDCTGSVIYCDDKICKTLKEKTLIIYIEATEDMKKKMFKNFIKHPKPIIWGDSFQKEDGESDMEALERCYPKLLDYRSQLYAKYADVKLPFHEANAKLVDTKEFLENIKKYL